MTEYFRKASVIDSLLNSQSSEAVAEGMKIQMGKAAFLQAFAVFLLDRARFYAFPGPGQYETIGTLHVNTEQLR